MDLNNKFYININDYEIMYTKNYEIVEKINAICSHAETNESIVVQNSTSILFEVSFIYKFLYDKHNKFITKNIIVLNILGNIKMLSIIDPDINASSLLNSKLQNNTMPNKSFTLYYYKDLIDIINSQ